MSPPRRSAKKAPIIESSSDSEDKAPVKKSKLSPNQESKVVKTKAKENYNDSSSSDSDIENYLQPVDKLDFSSSFFNLKKDTDEEFNKIEKHIFDGINVCRLSDSESDLDDPKPSASGLNKNEKDQVQANTKAPKLNFQQLEEFTRKIEEAKIHVEKYNAKKKIKEKNVDVSNILAAGESKQLTLDNIRAEDLHSSDFQTSDDEDWEEVKIKEQEEKPLVSKTGIEIRIGEMPDHCRKKKGVDLLAAMKRRLNRIRKENQIYVHKVHLLCWIAHGNFVNSVISDSEMLGLALSLLPSDKCYPSDRIDLGYLEQIVQWYKRTMKLSDKGPPQQLALMDALKLQINKKEAYDKKMFVLIFISILRALGVQCRMVFSFQVEPIRPPSSELHSLSAKEANKKGANSKSAQSSKSQVKKSVKKETGIVKDSKLGTGKKSIKSDKRPTGTSIQKSAKETENLRLKSNDIKNDTGECSNPKNGEGNKVKLNFLKLKSTKEIGSKLSVVEKNQKENNTRKKKETVEDVNSEIRERSSTRKKVTGTGKISVTEKESNVEIKIMSESKNKSIKKDISENHNRRQLRNSGQNRTNVENSNERSTSKKVEDNKGKKSEDNNRKEDVKSKDTLSLEEYKKSRTKSASTAGKKSQESKTRSKSTSSVLKIKLPNYTRSKKSEEKEIPQVDGSNDDGKPKKESKPNLQKLKSKSTEKICPVKKHSKRLKSSANNDDSENEFSSSPLKKSPEKKINFSKLDQPTSTARFGNQLDVRNDIINLIKGRIVEQKYADRGKMVQKKKPQTVDSDSDSDCMPQPIKKKHHDSDSDIEYFVPTPKIKKRVSVKRLGPGQPILSDSGDESGKKKKKGNNVWLEVFLESEEKWITADVIRGQVHCVNELYMRAAHPVSYIVAWNNDHTIKDVTLRYCKSFNTITRKLRINAKWWDETIKPFKEKSTARSKDEDHDLNRQQLDQPLPRAISEYKNHPLYALRRHLLKFEAIYPSEIVPLGFVRGEPVYPRNCVYTCRSRDIWLKEAKVVKPGEKPYKIVKARPKWDKMSNTVITDQLLEIFGEWQTQDYDPPTAENGVVPRNAFGNVELFKPCMLPKGTSHLRLPGLNKVCKKLNIDCASAIVGFDFNQGYSHPVYDGFVVCEEFTDTLIAAWDMEQEEIEKRENEKIEKRVYTNWKKLIKGLLIRERLKARYNFGGETSKTAKGKKNASTSKGPKFATKKRKTHDGSESDSS